MVKPLLEKGAESESERSKSGRTPPSLSAMNWYEAVVMMLVETGAQKSFTLDA
jgi:hypothetical protein